MIAPADSRQLTRSLRGLARQERMDAVTSFFNARSDYDAARETRYRRRRKTPAHGRGANYHFRTESDYLRIMEYARDFERNDGVVSSLIDRSVINEIQSGFTCKFNTGDPRLDDDLEARWTEDREDPEAIDVDGNMNFLEMEYVTSVREKVCGDIFGNLVDKGRVELLEGHRARSPYRTKKHIVHGVELAEGTNRPIRYWFTKNEMDPFRPMSQVRLRDLAPIEAKDSDGFPRILHLFHRRRSSQTRGISAFAPVFDQVTMRDDIDFAKMLQQQIASCFAIFKERSMAWDGPPDPHGEGRRQNALTGRYLEDYRPGLVYAGEPGETLKGFSPNVPNPEYFHHVKWILTVISLNLGLPLVIALMDASETNFSGWRGALDQAKLGWRHNQRNRVCRWHRPFMRHRVRYYGETDTALGNAIRRRIARPNGKVDPFRHYWCPPAWPYIEPSKDAMADLIKEANGQTSPRRRSLERTNVPWATLAPEIVEDRGLMIRLAVKEAKAINEEFDLAGTPFEVHWERLATLPTADGVTKSLQMMAALSAPTNNEDGDEN